MTFTARIRRASPVYRHWIEQHLKRASLCAVPFIRTPVNDFVFDGESLTIDQVARMRTNPCVDLEVRTEPVLADIETLNALTAVDAGSRYLPEISDRSIGVIDTNMGDVKEPAVYVPPRPAQAATVPNQPFMSRAERRRQGR